MKYKIRTDLKLEVKNITLYRIERISNGELGGYIEKESNLSQDGTAWVFSNARVSGNAWVCDNAQIFGGAQIYGNAWVSGNGWVSGTAQVFGDGVVSDNAVVYENAQVYSSAQVFGNARVFGNAQVFGHALVYGRAQVFGDARVYGNAQVYGDAQIENKNQLVNFIIPDKHSLTITPDNIAIGCQLKSRVAWTKVTEEQALEMGLLKELYPYYMQLIKTGMKLVPSRVKLNKQAKP